MTKTSGAPPWGLLVTLAALVLAVHGLLLQASPNRLGTKAEPELAATRAFSTRSIDAAPTPQARPTAPAPAARPPPRVRPASKPENQQNMPVAPVDSAEQAIDLVANEATQNPADSTPTSGLGSPTLAGPSAAPSPAPAASSAVASGPAGPAGPPTTAVTAITLPGSTRLQYKVTGSAKGLNYFADAELAWRNNGSQYEASMKVSALFLGARSMSSVGLITPGGLAPTRFADKYKSELAAHFQVDKGKISFSANTPDAAWFEGTQDRVSVFLQLGGMLAGKPADFPVGSSITLYTVGPREADSWTFIVEAQEQLALPWGSLATLRLIRKPRREYDQKIEIWYAPGLAFLPVRNRITQQNGDFIDQQLTEVVKP